MDEFLAPADFPIEAAGVLFLLVESLLVAVDELLETRLCLFIPAEVQLVLGTLVLFFGATGTLLGDTCK